MLNSRQRAFLSSLATSQGPTVMVGKEGASEAVLRALDAEFRVRELVKVRFVSGKEERLSLSRALAEASEAELVRTVGNVAVLYRQAQTPEDRRIELPS